VFYEGKEHNILKCACERLFFKLLTQLPIRAAQNVYPTLLKTEKMPQGTHDIDKI